MLILNNVIAVLVLNIITVDSYIMIFDEYEIHLLHGVHGDKTLRRIRSQISWSVTSHSSQLMIGLIVLFDPAYFWV